MKNTSISMEDRFCTLCGPEAKKKVKYPPTFSEEHLNEAIFSARRLPDKVHFQLVECSDCGLIYSDPACSKEHLSHLYLESLVNYGSQEQQIYDSYSPILDRGLERLKSKGTFLEIGGGSGFMLRYGAEKGFVRQIEIEPSGDAEKKFRPPTPQARFIKGVFEKGILAPNSVTLACFFQMLDHVPNPRSFLEDVLECLEPGGVAVCVTHNTNAFSAKILKERSPIYDIEHTYLFNVENIKKIFEKTGFANVDSFSISNRYAMKYWAALAPIPKVAKNQVLKFLDITQLGTVRIPLRAGNLAVIASKPI